MIKKHKLSILILSLAICCTLVTAKLIEIGLYGYSICIDLLILVFGLFATVHVRKLTPTNLPGVNYRDTTSFGRYLKTQETNFLEWWEGHRDIIKLVFWLAVAMLIVALGGLVIIGIAYYFIKSLILALISFICSC